MKTKLPHLGTLMLAILVIASLVSSFYLPLGGRRVRLEHIAGPTVFVVFAVSQLVRRKAVIRMDGFSALAAAWVVANGISSWLYAPNTAESFVHVIRLGVLGAIFLTVANLAPLSAEAWRSRVRLWLALGMLELAYGLLIWLLARYWNIWLPGTSLEALLVGVSIQGTQFERNLFGILAATVLVVAGYILFAQRHRRQEILGSTAFIWGACVVSAGAAALALTRSAWLAVILASPVAYLLFDRRSWARADRPLLHNGIGSTVLLGIFIAVLQILPAPGSAFAARVPASAVRATAPAADAASRLATFGRLQTDFTVNTRVQDAKWAIDDWLANPLLGRGTGSFAQIHGTRVGTEAWLSNLVLHTLLDTGLVGLGIQVLLFGLVARRAWQTARAATDAQFEIGLKALTVGFLVMAIAYQATDGTWLAVFWIHLGLMVNGIYSARAGVESNGIHHATD